MGLPTIDVDIPSPFRWNDSFKVFYETLDEEHKGLFDVAFDVNAKRGDKGTFDSASTLFKKHFDDEEAIMKAAVDAGKLDATFFKDHQGKHNNFLAQWGSFSLPVGDPEINYAMKWLVKHIKTTDFQYKGKLE